MRRFRHAYVTGNVEELMAVLHADATLIADGGGKAAAATNPVLGADRIAQFVVDLAGKMRWSESDFHLVMINGAPGLLMRHPISGSGTYSFDIADGRIRAILRRTQPRQAARVPRAHALSAEQAKLRLQEFTMKETINKLAFRRFSSAVNTEIRSSSRRRSTRSSSRTH